MKPDNVNIPRPEVAPNVPAQSLDRLPPLPAPEAGLTVGAERHEQVAELSAAQADAASTAVPATMLAQPTIIATDPAVSAAVGSTPLAAAHDDLIEKEWVDKAKEIISKTPNDPYTRGEQVGSLQKDYLRKRYGKELGAAS
jgi:hypothetical protein